MIEIKGAHGSAKVFSDTTEAEAIAQIQHLLNQEFVAGSQIRVMPDVHAGAGCTIGTTMTIGQKVVPNMVGVDIGCGMETLILENKRVELAKLDKVIQSYIPAGFSIRQKPHLFMEKIDLSALRCVKQVNLERARLSLGTLGGGNHFIEPDKNDEGDFFLVIHSGSRNLGKQVAEHYQAAAFQDLKKKGQKVEKALAYCEGQLLDDYLHDMAIVQSYASWNRRAMAREIEKQMKWTVFERFTTIHNYIDLETRILRKGAISAKEGERVLIPMNMRDGSLICQGKGNPDWNFSAPHGAGRLMSRSAAKASITLSAFQKSMEGIYSSTVNKSTLDESPFAYKPMEEILENIGETVQVLQTIRPVYNFKAAE